jgi:hypothetical protein
MKLLALVVLCVPLLIAGCGSPAPTAGSSPTSSPAPSAVDETAAVHAAFDTYAKAALAKDGATAEGALADTIAVYYDDVRKQALTGTEETVGALPPAQRMTVYILRAEIEPAVLRDSKPADLVRLSVDKGLVGEQGISNLSLGKVTATGDKAEAEILSGGKVAPFTMKFLREEGAWKLDLAPLMAMADDALTAAAQQQGTTADAMIGTILETKYGAARVAELRQPLER